MNLGTLVIDGLKLGTLVVDKVYLGALLAWSSEPPVVPTDYLAFYTLDTDSLDSSANNYDGTDYGGITYDGVAGVFNGIDKYITVPNLLGGYAESFSFSFFVKHNVLGLEETYLNTYDGQVAHIVVRKLTDNTIEFQLRDSNNILHDIFSTTILSSSQYYFITGVYDHSSNDMTLYVNASLENTEATTFSGSFDNNYDIELGTKQNTLYLNGGMSNVRWHNRVLSLVEITAIYNAELAEHNLVPTDYISYYTLDTDPTDSSANNFDGTSYGGITYDGVGGVFAGTDDYIGIPHNTAFTSINRTMCMWVKNSQVDADSKGLIFKAPDTGFDREVSISLEPTTRVVRYTLSNGSILYNIESTTTMDDGLWHFVVCVIENGVTNDTGYLYVDNVLEGSLEIVGHQISNTEQIVFGKVSSTSTAVRHYQGLLSNARFYDRVISLAEITAIYNAEVVEHLLPTNFILKYPLIINSLDITTTYNGTDYNGVVYNGDGALFDGVDSYIDTGYKTSNDSNEYSIVGWVKRNTINTQDCLYSETDSTSTSNGAYISFADDGLTLNAGHFKTISSDYDLVSVDISPFITSMTDWIFVCFTRENGVEHKLYVDAILVGTVACADFTSASTYTGKIGDSADSTTSRPFDGLVADFAIYPTVLSLPEITAIYIDELAEHS